MAAFLLSERASCVKAVPVSSTARTRPVDVRRQFRHIYAGISAAAREIAACGRALAVAVAFAGGAFNQGAGVRQVTGERIRAT